MKSRTLYVIGNGFDLWHGISSSLWQFKQYVEANDREVAREVEEYLPTQEDWSDLEMALADMDVDSLIDNLGHFMGSYGSDDWSDAGHHDFQYEVANVVTRLSKGLQSRFAEWVRSIPIPSPATAQKRLGSLDKEALFFSFNYTATLTKLYSVSPDQIVFIHGCAERPNDDLVLGHAWNPRARRSLNDRPDIEEMDTRLAEANDVIDDYFSATFKRSAELIARHQAFFAALTDIDHVIVLGHSLSDVDAAYFEALLQRPSVVRAHWHVACRSADDWTSKRESLHRLGVDLTTAQPVLWDAI